MVLDRFESRATACSTAFLQRKNKNGEQKQVFASFGTLPGHHDVTKGGPPEFTVLNLEV